MPQEMQCPDQAQLSGLLLGTLDEHQLAVWGSHLLACQRCAVRAETISPSDELTVSLRGSDTLLPVESDPLVQRLRSQLHQLRVLPPSSAVDAATLSISSPTEASVNNHASVSSAPEERSHFTFLGVPQGADEIGRLGQYRILKVLGQGGMGVVFQAEDTRLGRLCALKAMLPETAAKSGMKERFLREARAAAQIEHDHIIPIYQVDEDWGVPYIAMPFLKGMSLEDWIRKQTKSSAGGSSIPVPVIVKLGRQIAKGLAAAHDRGLIHRDIKPANIWLDASAGGRVKILDFGLARLSEAVEQQHLTQTGMIMGTPSYMSPEQANAETVDGRADLFSLGVILYRLCTGRLPFVGKDTLATLMALASHTPPPPHTVNPTVPRSLSDAVMHLLEKEPAERTPSAQQLMADLQSIEQDLSTDASESLSLSSASATSQPASGALSDATLQPQSQRVAPPRWPLVRWPLIVAAVAGIALMVAGVVLFWQTPHGTVRIEINDPSITAQIDANGADITKADKPLLRLRPGVHGLRIKHGEVEFETETFILAQEEIVDLKIERLAGEIRVTADGKSIGSKPLPAAETVASRGQSTMSATGTDQAEPTRTRQIALRLDEKLQIMNRSLKVDPARPFTLEAWITPVHNVAEWVGLIRISPEVGISIMHSAEGIFWHFAMGSTGKARAPLATAGSKPVHVACVRTDEELILYLDGRVEARAELSSTSLPTDQYLAIGDVTGRPYESWMDEIRISKVARYKKEFTPDRRFEPDDDTLALYHCDEGSGQVLNDYSGNGYHCRVNGGKWVNVNAKPETEVKPHQPADTSASERSPDLALRLDETTQISMKNLNVDVSRPFTLETWVTPWRDRYPNGTGLVRFKDTIGLRINVTAVDTSAWVFSLGVGVNAMSRSTAVVNKPAHVAGVRTENELLLFINGRVESRVPAAAGPYPDSLNLFLGTAGHYAFIGTLNEVRISTVARYLKEFTPAERFEPDEVTLALYHCDEGSGDLLIDSSGHGYHCDIDRAEWVKADATSVDDRRQPQQTKPLSAPAAASPAVGSSGAQEVSRLINRMAPAKPTPPIPETWTLRSIAQWAIELGGKVLLGDGRVISKIEDLPETVERIDLVDFTGLGSAFGDAEANIAGSWPIIKGIAVADTSITDEGLRHLAGLPLGNSLSASYTSINGDGFESFREKSLGAISLRSCQLSPQGWRRLAAVGRTTAWHLQFSNLNDAALAEIISAHPEIETLNASCREVTDASATAIASVTEIRTLVLNTASISDETLKRLTGLKWLKALQVKETRVTAAGVEQLQQALPDCTITWK